MITTHALIESLEWLLKKANGSHVAIDIHAVRKVLDALKATAVVLLLCGSVDAHAANRAVIHRKALGELPGQRLNRSMRSSHRNNDPFGRSGLGDHITYNVRG
jgi:hypothetical protein